MAFAIQLIAYISILLLLLLINFTEIYAVPAAI